MRPWIVVCAMAATVALQPASASAQSDGASGVPRKDCISDEAKATLRQLKALNRRLTNADPQWPFDPDYFVGKWDVEWDVPESPLGQSGTVTGTMTIHHVEGCLYEGEMAGKDADGAFTSKIQIVYDPMAKYLIWIETNSRGYTLIRPGLVGGDLGGSFTHYWEVPAIRVNGKTVRLMGTTLITSPAFYRLRAQISTDGEPFSNYGNPWFRKEQTTAPSAGR